MRTKPSLVKNEKNMVMLFNPMSNQANTCSLSSNAVNDPRSPRTCMYESGVFFSKKIPRQTLNPPAREQRSFIRFLHRNAVSHLRMRQIDPHSRDLGCSPHEHLTAISHQESIFAPRDEESSTLLDVGNFRSQPRPR